MHVWNDRRVFIVKGSLVGISGKKTKTEKELSVRKSGNSPTVVAASDFFCPSLFLCRRDDLAASMRAFGGRGGFLVRSRYGV